MLIELYSKCLETCANLIRIVIIIFLLTFQFDNILMEESAQILEIETFIPLLLQVCYLQHQIILYCICDY